MSAQRSSTSGLFTVVGQFCRGITVSPLPAHIAFYEPNVSGPFCGRELLHMLAGIVAPRAGKVLILGEDPFDSPSRRRSTALMGDPILLDETLPLALAEQSLAAARGLATYVPKSPKKDAPTFFDRVTVADALSGFDTASTLLLLAPNEEDTKPYVNAVFQAIAAGASVAVATSSSLVPLRLGLPSEAPALVLNHGVVEKVATVGELPWLSQSLTRSIDVELQDDSACSLGARLLESPVGPSILSVEPLAKNHLRICSTDPRAVARYLARLTQSDLPLRARSEDSGPGARSEDSGPGARSEDSRLRARSSDLGEPRLEVVSMVVRGLP